MADYASEAGHWYNHSGDPCYTLIGKNGKERNTTLRDARKLSLVPSVTEILKVYPKPALVNWQIEQVKLAALTLPQIKGETLDQFSKRIRHDANEQSRVAVEKGTIIHGDLEKYFQGARVHNNIDICVAVSKALHKHFGQQVWKSEKSFSSPYGFGGKVDLHSDEWVIDFKTKEFTENDLDKQFSWNEHLLQLSAYRLGLGLPTAGIANVFISVKKRGLVHVDIHEKDETEQFLALLHFWKAYKKFDPSYE